MHKSKKFYEVKSNNVELVGYYYMLKEKVYKSSD